MTRQSELDKGCRKEGNLIKYGPYTLHRSHKWVFYGAIYQTIYGWAMHDSKMNGHQKQMLSSIAAPETSMISKNATAIL